MLKARKWLNFPTPPLMFEAPAREEPLRIRDEIWRQKTNRGATGWWRNHDASFFRFDTIPARDRQTDRRTDTLLSQTPAL